ncbi:MAG TPA: M48 family metalloprotease [Allosphingosinicella sp.]|uniref:M48 family metalloprotease n=1 Tax=Allosphingosinicella sp. TaxID=2823234 RepID=UPI002EDA69EC
MKIKALIALSASLAAIAAPSVVQGQSRSLAQNDVRQAAQQHPEVVAEFGGQIDATRNSYVAAVGNRVGAQTGVAGGGSGAYRFTALNSPVMNAFAVPGGYIYITRQLMGLMNDEAELASVLGHEVGHVAARHSQGRQQQGLLSQILSVGAAILTGSSQIGQLIGQVSQLRLLSYSRNQEFQADQLGINYITRAGYDPNGAVSLLASLGAATSLEARASGRDDERATPSWARTHPLSADRVSRAQREAQRTGAAGRGLRNREQYLNMIDGIFVDDDPAQGVVDGRTFSHPDLRLRFVVPQGYGIQNGTRAVSISGSNGQAQFSGGSYTGDLGTYIAQVFRSLGGNQAQIPFTQPQSTTVNGIPAAYSTARVNSQQGQVDVSVFAYRWDSNTVYHFATITRAGQGLGPFASMVQSISRLTAAQASAIRPRVIDVVTVRAGDTIQSLASRMAYSDLKTERFLTLNGLQANSRLAPGQRVKVVVYGTR